MDKPVGILSTKYGDITYLVHDDTLVSLRTDGSESLVMRKIPYNVNLELRFKGGIWDSHGEHQYFSRRDSWSKEPSWAARDALLLEVTRVWTEFVQHSPDLLVAGRRAKWESTVERKQNDIEEAREALGDLMRELVSLMQEEPALPVSNTTS